MVVRFISPTHEAQLANKSNAAMEFVNIQLLSKAHK